MSKFFAGLALVGLCVVLAGCGSQSAASAPTAGGGQSAAPAESDLKVAQSPTDSGMPVPPEGAEYTLHCTTFTDDNHVAEAQQTKEALVKMTGSNEWYIVHSANASDLYYGFYKTFTDTSQVQEFTRAQADRAKIESLVNQQGDQLFPEAGFAPIDTPDPPAPKEWDLSNNPGYWSLQIAVYKGNPLRKVYAVNAVKGFREHGVEAYFRHGPETSEVYIGSWPRSAVVEQDADSAKSDDPNQPLLVLSGPMQGSDTNSYYTPDGRKMKVVAPKLQIQDPTLLKAAQDYPYFYVNGEVVGRKAQLADRTWKMVPWPSYLIQIRPDNPNDDASTNKPDAGQGGDSGTSPIPSEPGLGGLRPGGG